MSNFLVMAILVCDFSSKIPKCSHGPKGMTKRYVKALNVLEYEDFEYRECMDNFKNCNSKEQSSVGCMFTLNNGTEVYSSSQCSVR